MNEPAEAGVAASFRLLVFSDHFLGRSSKGPGCLNGPVRRRFHALPASVSKTCLVRFDNNKYSVNASAVGHTVEIRAYADRVLIRQDGRIVADYPRAFGRGATICDPWHYVPVLARKPGALRYPSASGHLAFISFLEIAFQKSGPMIVSTSRQRHLT